MTQAQNINEVKNNSLTNNIEYMSRVVFSFINRRLNILNINERVGVQSRKDVSRDT